MNKNNRNSRTLLCHFFIATTAAAVIGACGDPVDVEPEPIVSTSATTARAGDVIEIETAWQGLCSDDGGSYTCLPQEYQLSLECLTDNCTPHPSNPTLARGAALVGVITGEPGEISVLATLENLDTGEVFETEITATVTTTLDHEPGEISPAGAPGGTTLEHAVGEILDDHDVGSAEAQGDGSTLDHGAGELLDARGIRFIAPPRWSSLDRRGDEASQSDGRVADRPRFAPGRVGAERQAGNQLR